MKIIFNNEIKNSTITAAAPNANYPASNLSHVFAKVKYKGLGYSDVITVVFDDNIEASGFMYTYTNATSMVVQVYSNSSVLLETLNIDCTYNSGASYFTKHTDVRRLVITIASDVAQDIYLGGIAIGVAFEFPYPIANFDKGLLDGSSKSISNDGQTSYHYMKPLLKYSLAFQAVNRTSLYHLIVDQFLDVGSGHIWVDISDLNHTLYQPLYCTTQLIENPTRSRNRVSFTLTLTEAR